MNYYLSVNGGGTKTDFLLTDRAGRPVARRRLGGCTYSYIGQEGVCELLEEGARLLLRDAAAGEDEVACAVWGIPCYGEDRAFDGYVSRRLPRVLPCAHRLCNDVELGLAGSLLLGPGVHVVAGTGAIAMGRDPGGKTARANGWHEFFSDEGSAYWLGRQALALFAQQADLRRERGPLYELLRAEWGLESDYEVIRYYRENLENRRERIAAVQKLLCRAAEAGDRDAARLYEQAARALARTAGGVLRQLDFPEGEPVRVSYYGGVYRAGARILAPFGRLLGEMGAVLTPPALPPLCGGVLLAAQADGRDDPAEIAETLKSFEEMERK